MKSLFSVYNSTSVKKTIIYRAAIMGLLMILCGVAVGLKLNHLEQVNNSVSNYYSKVVNGTETFSQEKVNEFNSGDTGLTIFFWGSLSLLVLSLIFIPTQIINYFLSSLKILKQQVEYLTSGDLSKRITFIKNKDEFGEIFWDLNDATDQFEALIKELTTSIEYVTSRKYFRPVLAKGMHGSYSSLLKTADLSLKKYSDELIKEREKVENKAEQLLNAMEKFSQGDLTECLEIENSGDLMGKLFAGFNNSVSNINNMIKEVNEAVNSTISASTQIAAAIEEMAAASEEQSRQTNDITVAIDEMIKVVTETTQNTSAAAESSRNAGSMAEEGSEVVQKAVGAMGQIANIVSEASGKVVELGKNSDKIGEIIQVINEIADQTNLLALNAAIEAARAGEHGRGFAVVADEVRKLAERTTNSTEEIASMIKQIQNDTTTVVSSINEGNKEVETGISLAESAGQAILNIVNTTNNVVDEINQVATAAEEQSLTSEQIAQNIESVNNVISETLLGIQQTASAAEDLNNMTTNLQELVKQFKIKNDVSNKINFETKKESEKLELVN